MSDEDEEVGMSTEDFADYRGMIGKEPFEYKGKMIVGYADDPYRNFGVKGDNAFIVDSLLAKPGPSWNDFVEAINGGSIFSIITARGHTPSVLREAIYNMIVTNHNGISKESLIDNLKKYRNMSGDEEKDSSVMINDYLDLNKYHPVTYGEGNAADPEEGKIKAALIVAPKGVYDNWVKGEVPIHLPKRIPRHIMRWIPAKTQRFETDLKDFIVDRDPKLKVFVMNTGGFLVTTWHRSG